MKSIKKIPQAILDISCGTMASIIKPCSSIFGLVGNENAQYDVIYRIHARWVKWAKNNNNHSIWQDSWVAFIKSL